MEIIVFLNFLIPVTIIRRVKCDNKSMRKNPLKIFIISMPYVRNKIEAILL